MKVLIVLNNLRVANGVATVMMNQYDALVQNGYTVDFLQFLDFDSPYVEHIRENGGKIVTLQKGKSSLKKMRQVLREGQYDILHVNQMNAQTVQLVVLARCMGMRHVVYHSHNTKIPGNWKRKMLEKGCNLFYRIFANHFVACSTQAGRDAFGTQKFTVLKNSIDVARFRFDAGKRRQLREQLNISEKTFVVGTVCRYAEQKNPILMIDIVNEILKINPNTVFLWVGSAPTEDDPTWLQMQQRVQQLGIQAQMRWVGSKADVYNWYSAMDVFLMPSRWEGLGITYIEAQANSLPTFASDVVPKDTQITELIRYIPLSCAADVWAEELMKCPVRGEGVALVNEERLVQAGYDSAGNGQSLLAMYKKFAQS